MGFCGPIRIGGAISSFCRMTDNKIPYAFWQDKTFSSLCSVFNTETSPVCSYFTHISIANHRHSLLVPPWTLQSMCQYISIILILILTSSQISISLILYTSLSITILKVILILVALEIYIAGIQFLKIPLF